MRISFVLNLFNLKKLIFFASLILFNTGHSQVVKAEIVNRLYYTCKIWGYLKYHHSGINANLINWDSTLISHIKGIQEAPTHLAFQDSLYKLVNSAGSTVKYLDYWGFRGDSIQINRNFTWFKDTHIPNRVRDTLNKIKLLFKNEGINSLSSSQNYPFILSDDKYSNENENPEIEKKLLALFRYWNLIEYFYPFKNFTSDNWDETLKKYLDEILEIKTKDEYNILFRKLTKSTRDSKGNFNSLTYDNMLGTAYFPFLLRYIEGKTIIYRKLDNIQDVEIGDELLQIEEAPVPILRNNLRSYAQGANEASVERNIDILLMRGDSGTYNIIIKKSNGSQISIAMDRSPNYSFAIDLLPKTRPYYDTVLEGGCKIGVMDFRLIQSSDLIDAIVEDLYPCDAWVLDLRGNAQMSFESSFSQYIYNRDEAFRFFKYPNFSIPGEFYSRELGTYFLYNHAQYQKRIILLVDEYTRDVGESFAAAMAYKSHLLTIGSMTDGSGVDIGLAIVKLPGKITTNFSYIGAYHRSGKPFHINGITIDSVVKPTIKGIQQGRDEILETALKCSNTSFSTVANNESLHIDIFPNPCHNFVNIQSKQSIETIEIYDMMGKNVYHIDTKKLEYKIDMEVLSQGIYFVKVNSLAKMFKLVKN